MFTTTGIFRSWLWYRRQGGSERDIFAARSYMRQLAHDYAVARGWTVKLTPPQRSHQ